MNLNRTFLGVVIMLLSTTTFAQSKPDLALLEGNWESTCTLKDGYSYKVIPFIRSAKNLKPTDYPSLDRTKLSESSAVVINFTKVFANETCGGKGQTVMPPQLTVWDVDSVSTLVPGAFILKMTDSKGQVTFDLIGNLTPEGFELSTEPNGKVVPTSLGHKYSKYTEK